MALIISRFIEVEPSTFPEGASRHYLYVPATLLSEPYNLIDGDEIKGEIEVLAKDMKQISELKGQEITLILKKSVIYDFLYISEFDWKTFFREWGLVLRGYLIKLRLTEVLHKATNVSEKLYTKADVTG